MNKEGIQQHDSRATLVAALESLMSALEGRMHEIAEEHVNAELDLYSYSIRTVMERLDVTIYVVRKMIMDGTLEAVRPTEGTVRITARSLRQFLYGTKEGSKK